MDLDDEVAMLDREINLQQELSKLGNEFESIHTVATIEQNGKTKKVILKRAAGYVFPSSKSKEKPTVAIDFEAAVDYKLTREATNEERFLILSALKDPLKGVEKMHNEGYINRDIKVENILMMPDGKGVLTDFGSVCKQDGDAYKYYNITSPMYAAPECTLASPELSRDRGLAESITTACDVWSVGMLLFNVNEGTVATHPYYDGNPPNTAERQISYGWTMHTRKETQEKYLARLEKWVDSDPDNAELYQLIADCCQVDPEMRPTMAEVNTRYEKALENMKPLFFS